MIGVTSKGDFKKTRDYLNKLIEQDIFSDFDAYGRMGVDALARATPVDSGVTAASWFYGINPDRNNPGIYWYNTSTISGLGGTSLVILLQYGHGTGTGGYVQGRDFINPAIKPVFDYIQTEVWKKVTA